MTLRLQPKTFFLAAGLVAVVGAGAIYTAYTGLTEADGRVAALRREARDEKTVRAELAKTQAAIGELSAKLRHLEEGVPSFAYIPSMTRELETVGRADGLEVLGIRPMVSPPSGDDKEPKGAKKAYEELTIAVRGRGSYGAVKRFLQGLTRFPKIVEVRTLTLAPKTEPGKTDAAPKLDADITIRAYAFKDAAPAVEANPTHPTPKAKVAPTTPQMKTASLTHTAPSTEVRHGR